MSLANLLVMARCAAILLVGDQQQLTQPSRPITRATPARAAWSFGCRRPWCQTIAGIPAHQLADGAQPHSDGERALLRAACRPTELRELHHLVHGLPDQ